MAAFANHPFETFAAVGGLVGALVGLLSPGSLDDAAIGHVTRGLLPYWEGLYLVASVCVLWGLLSSLRIEAAGLFLLIGADTIQTISAIDYKGIAASASAATYLGIAIAAAIRIRVLFWLVKRRGGDRR